MKGYNSITSVPWSVIRTKYDSIPKHYAVALGRPIDTLWGIILQPLEVPHESL